MHMSSPTRLEVKLKEPNTLLAEWLELKIKETSLRQNKSQHKLREAFEALRRYPLPLNSGRDCAILRGFGIKLCILIDVELMPKRSSYNLSKSPELAKCNDYYNQCFPLYNDKIIAAVESNKKPTKKKRNALSLAKECERHLTMSAGSFRIKLLVDTQETSGKHNRISNQTRRYLESLYMRHEVRRLIVGDFLWVATDQAGYELVLPYVVERKRMDDLASSIRDGRFHEQKHRLHQCGIQHVIYLVEDYRYNEHVGLPLKTLCQALANTQIQNDFKIVRTENNFRSIAYLQSMTNTLIRLYRDKTLINTVKELMKSSQPHDQIIGLFKFREFYENSLRNARITIREVFILQLLQLHSLSIEKAVAIVGVYKTPRQLIDAFVACENQVYARRLLAGIGVGRLQRLLGYKISQCVYEFYSTGFQ